MSKASSSDQACVPTETADLPSVAVRRQFLGTETSRSGCVMRIRIAKCIEIPDL